MSALDLLGPHRGPCAFCDHPDARHREADAIRGRVAAGEPLAEVAADHDLPESTVEALVEAPA